MIKTSVAGLLVSLMIVISGCTSHGTSLTKSGMVTIDCVPTEKISMTWVEAYQDANNLILTGVIAQSRMSINSSKTHVDVTILDGNGQVLHQLQTKDIYVPPKRPGKGIPWARFETTMPVVVSEKTVIKAVCHSGEHS